MAGSGIDLDDHGVFHLPSIDQAWRLFHLAGPASDSRATGAQATSR